MENALWPLPNSKHSPVTMANETARREDGETARKPIRHLRDLDVYQNALVAGLRVYELTKRFPIEERYALTDQARRSSRSVCANTAEAWRKRRYEAAFVAKLSDAESEAAETQTWLDFAVRCGYLDKITVQRLESAYDKIIGQLVVMIQNTQDWILTKPALPQVPRSPSPQVRRAIGLIFGLLAAATIAKAADWPQWRGPNRDGHAAGSTTISSLPKELKPVWKNAIGPGFSAPIISGGKVIYLD